MIKYLSNKVATYIAQNDESADFEVMAYGFELLFQEIVVLIVATLFALPFGLPLQVLLTSVAYNLLRASAGGAHAKYRFVCLIVSVLVTFGPAFVYAYGGVAIPTGLMAGLCAADLVVLLLYAPGDTEIKPIQTPQKRKRYKRKAVTLAGAYFAIAFLIKGYAPAYASILATVPTLVALFNLPPVYWILGCKRSTVQ